MVVAGVWMAKELGLSLSSESVDRVCEMHSSVCALLLLDLAQAGKLPKGAKFSYWKGFEAPEALHGDLWLLSYEAGVRGWSGFSDVHIRHDPHFDLLRQQGVHFYDQNASLKPLFHVKTGAFEQFQAASESELFDLPEISDLSELVDFDVGDSGYEAGAPATSDEFEDETKDGNEGSDVGDYSF